MEHLLAFETDSHSIAQDETTGVSHQARLFITIEKHVLKVILSASVEKVLLFFSCCFIGHHKNKTKP